MGIAKKAAKRGAQYKAVDAADSARPYIQRLIEDEQLRDSLREAFDSARNAYDRASDKGSPFDMVDDSKLHNELKTAAESLKYASEAMREPEKRPNEGGSGILKLLVVAVVAAVLALVLSEGLRKTALDALFGAEEEFEYSSTTSPPEPPAGGGGASAS